MNCGIFDFACHVGNGLDGLGSFLFGWFWAIPWGWLIAGVFIGSILGARFGWLAVVSLGTSILVGLVGPRLMKDDPSEVDGPDAAPSPPQPRPRPKREPRKPLFPNAPWNRRK